MHFDVKFNATDQSFTPSFGEVHNISDGGYERGYDAGYKKGSTDGQEVGYNKGHAEGYIEGETVGRETGYAEGHDVGYAEGEKAEYDRFWDAFQDNGNKTNYDQAFAYGNWTDDCFNPKHDITCGTGVSARQVFYNAKITSTKVPIRVRGNNAAMNSTFAGCNALKTIVLLELVGVTSFSSTFNLCSALENITIEGSIDESFNTSATAVLTNASVQSIIDHLKDLTGQTPQELTLHATVGAKLTAAQKAAITAKNWTLVY